MAAQYAMVADPTSRTSLRAHVLSLIERLALDRQDTPPTRIVSATELSRDPTLRGAIVMHLDLVFRSSVTSSELMFTAERGLVRIAEHANLAGFPIGASLSMPLSAPVRSRRELFAETLPALDRAEVLMVFALATSPPGLGAGVRLLAAAQEDAASLPTSPRVLAFSPLTGLRARLIQLVDDPASWTAAAAAQPPGIDVELLRHELFDLLARDTMPDVILEPARGWLAAEARQFAASTDYKVGNFHRARGGALTGVADGGDPRDSDSMWARAYFDYRSAPVTAA